MYIIKKLNWICHNQYEWHCMTYMGRATLNQREDLSWDINCSGYVIIGEGGKTPNYDTLEVAMTIVEELHQRRVKEYLQEI